MPKNIVLCCDGTGNEFGRRHTNVVKLFSVLERSGQALFYDPGVGTFELRETWSRPARSAQKALGLALGVGFRKNVVEAYDFLARHFEPGDRVFLFGFSRGAYTARVVAALLRGVGVLRPGQDHLVPYALSYLQMSGGTTDWKRLRGFRREFARPEMPAFVFLGLWDTVSSISWIWDRLVYTATASNRAVDVVRHAVSIDERRAFFRTNLWKGRSKGQDVKEVWFAGVHSDVGGSYPEKESGLSKIALEWMLEEARQHGLDIDLPQARKLLAKPQSPDPGGQVHRSSRGWWWIAELVPKRPYSRGKRRLRLNLARRRGIPGCPTIHASVVEKMRRHGYDPPNLPNRYRIEPWVRLGSLASTSLRPSSTAVVQARRRWNRTGFRVEQGVTYRFRALGQWSDSSRRHGVAGERSYDLVTRLFSGWKRLASAPWFSLIACIDRQPSTLFDLGETVATGAVWRAPASGTLYAFANDVPFMYWNNSGEVLLSMREAQLLTKSRFLLARHCPRKLHYLDHPETYGDWRAEDPFLDALAEGGLQVGALARLRFPGGTEIQARDSARAVLETEELLRRDEVVLYEAAFRHENLLVRVDVLVKRRDKVELYEVKAKAIDSEAVRPFFKKRAAGRDHDELSAKWEPYLADLAFQHQVCRLAYPDLEFEPYLVLLDKRARSTEDGLHRKIRVSAEDGRRGIVVESGAENATHLLSIQSAREAVDFLAAGAFADEVDDLARAYRKREPLEPRLGAHCGSCEFRTPASERQASGFAECWQTKVAAKDVDACFVFDVWNLRGADELIERGVFLARDLQREDLAPEGDGSPGLSRSERQWQQVRRLREGDTSVYLDLDGLRAEMEGWTYPLHFIDLETAAPSLPLHAGRRPYEAIAFQFSHHTMQADGSIAHAGEFLAPCDGPFPNFDLVRELQRQLGEDEGSIFRYASHENTILCEIRRQLIDSEESDRHPLIAFLESVTHSGKAEEAQWKGPRDMVDLHRLVKRYAYYPAAGGSVGIKKVLPAILEESTALQRRYSEPIYGTVAGIPSRNFERFSWLRTEEGDTVLDPYDRLPSPCEGLDANPSDAHSNVPTALKEGSAAMTAYLTLQLPSTNPADREALRRALLRYCELDTLAMVMIVEHWRDALEPSPV